MVPPRGGALFNPESSALLVGPTAYGSPETLATYKNGQRFWPLQTESQCLPSLPIHLGFAHFRNRNSIPLKSRVRVVDAHSSEDLSTELGNLPKGTAPEPLVMTLLLFPHPCPHHTHSEQHPPRCSRPEEPRQSVFWIWPASLLELLVVKTMKNLEAQRKWPPIWPEQFGCVRVSGQSGRSVSGSETRSCGKAPRAGGVRPRVCSTSAGSQGKWSLHPHSRIGKPTNGPASEWEGRPEGEGRHGNTPIS